MRPQIALFGGSFHPPHNGHKAIIQWLCDGPFDEVWVLPTVQHRFKDLPPYETRKPLVDAMISEVTGSHKVRVVRRDESRTIETVEALQSLHPQVDFHLILGADIQHETHKWHRWSDLASKATVWFVSRKGVHGNAFTYQTDAPEVSSSEIRERLAAGRSLDGLVPQQVARCLDSSIPSSMGRRREHGHSVC